jgi:phage-related protein
LSEELGAALLPAFDKLLPLVEKFTTWASENSGVLTAIIAAVAAFAAIIVIINAAMAIATAVTAAWGIAVAIATSPITLIVLAILAVIAVVVLLYKNWDTIIAWLKSAWASVKEKAIEIWGSLKDWFARTWEAIKEKLRAAWEGIKSAVSTGVDRVVEFVKALPGRVVSGIGNLARTLFSKGVDLLQGFVNGYLSIWKTILSFAGGIVGKVAGAIGNVGSALYNKGRDLIQGFVNGIKSMGSAILDAILSLLPNSIEGVVRRAIGLSSPVGSGAAAAGRSLGAGSTRRSVGNVTFNLYGDPVANERAIKRALQGYDVSMGRKPGQKLARAW